MNKAYTVSLSEGPANAAYNIDAVIKNTYLGLPARISHKTSEERFIQEFMNPTPPAGEFVAGNDPLARAAANNDMAIIAIGRNAGKKRQEPLLVILSNDTEKALIKKRNAGLSCSQ